MNDRPLGVWFKSSKSGPNCDNCVEVRFVGDGRVEVRNSRRPEAGALTFTADQWNAFVVGVAGVRFVGDALVEMRNIHRPEDGSLTFDADEWNAFVDGAVKGEFAIPAHAL